MLDCAVIVVTHNSGSTWPRACAAILDLEPPAAELCVVDNASSELPEMPQRPRLRAQRIVNQDNLGFAVASNQGAAATQAAWLLFLNPDCFLQPTDLATLLARAEAIPDLGVLGAHLVNADGSTQAASSRDDPTPRRLLAGPLSTASNAAATKSSIQWVETVSGALMLMPRHVFEAVGGFDLGYRLHCEDLDLCKRLQLAGQAVACATAVRVTHVKGTSSRRRPIWVEWQKHRGMWRYFGKFERAQSPAWLVIVVALGIALRFPLAAVRAWLEGF